MLVDVIFGLLLANSCITHARPGPTLPPPVLSDDVQENQSACQDYSSCGAKGLRYWNALQAKLQDPDAVDVDRRQLFLDYYGTEHGDTEDDAALEIQQDLLDLGLSPIDRYTKCLSLSRSSLDGPEDYETAYQNMFNTQDGAIIATSNDRAKDSQKRLFWSDVVFHNYVEEMQPSESLSTLRAVFQVTITNRGTIQVAKAAYAAQQPPLDFGSHGWKDWTLAKQPYFFYAFLGTDNVKGMAHLLTDHSVALGKKTITKIRTRLDNFDMWIELGPYAPGTTE
ncbi:MAG: hypothetical protein Q9221_003028 [Calogaya cf. arnoldii]